MSDVDFGIDSLAAYLHLDPARVAKLAERGKLPGRKVAGQWRFSQAEIHHWLETQIGASDDLELAEMEGVLRRNRGGPDAEHVSIVELLPLSAIAVPLNARTRGSVITSMVELAAQTGWLWDPGKMADAVRAREDMHPTALDEGVALLHPRRPLPAILDQACLALGRTESGIPFGGNRLTDIFFLICSLQDRGHLRVLARLSRLVADVDFMAGLRAAPDAASIHQLIADAEDKLVAEP